MNLEKQGSHSVLAEKYTLLDIKHWHRQQHFEFYRDFTLPYFQIGCDLKAKTLYQHCKQNQIAFFHAYLYLTMKTINQLEPFCYRVVDEQVRIYQNVTISVTVMAKDQTFRFCTIPYAESFNGFQHNFAVAREKALTSNFIDEKFASSQQEKATVYMSVIPWIHFTGYGHAWQNEKQDPSGIPRLVFGKMNDEFKLPFTVDCHHALVDGVNVAQFIDTLQSYFDFPNKVLDIG